ncbi:hypothetical protein POM88_028589 [Heracleum sosnowskyi]|uniref:Retrotransposon gag domain-containing protein n=1 Tax=Heracleum sosnowskyi TaxID=360622 RepID=A0AAD8HSI4_9APIA|nr:hypothetical protein POM88_028589 [Heracleum sosnowskyi]
MTADKPPGFEDSGRPGGSSTVTPLVNRTLNFDSEGDEGPMPTPEEQRELLLKWRQEQTAKKGKQRESDQAAKEAQIRAKKKEADLLKLEALRLRREEIEMEEKAIRDSVAEDENPLIEPEPQREKRPHDDEEESTDSESYHRRIRSKIVVSSESEDEDDPHVKSRLRRMEKAMFGERKINHEPVVTKEIEKYRPPPGRQFPKMNEFNGKGDPEDHCEKYESLMTGMGHCDVMLCKMFKTYLKGTATMWYRSQRPRSISSYDQLKRRFLRHYSHLCRREKDTEALIHCRQRHNEELGDYFARFKEEAGMVTNLDKVKAAGFLAAGLDPVKGKKLRSSLYDVPPKSLNDIYLRGEAIRRKLESIGGSRDSRKYESSGRDDRRGQGDIKSRLTDTRPDKGAERRRDRDSTVFTPLNAPISKILHEIKGKPSFVRPSRLKTPDHKKNEDKYCDYHRDKGHNTDQCYHLKKLIEKMIKGGELSEYVGDLRSRLEPREKNKDKEPDDKERYRGEVKTISGGGAQLWSDVVRLPGRSTPVRSTAYTKLIQQNNLCPSPLPRMIMRM